VNASAHARRSGQKDDVFPRPFAVDPETPLHHLCFLGRRLSMI
jgi:hypothetical protein